MFCKSTCRQFCTPIFNVKICQIDTDKLMYLFILIMGLMEMAFNEKLLDNMEDKTE